MDGISSPQNLHLESFDLPKAYQLQKTHESAKYNEYLKKVSPRMVTGDGSDSFRSPPVQSDLPHPITELGIMQVTRNGQKRNVYGYRHVHNLGVSDGLARNKPTTKGVMTMIAKTYNNNAPLVSGTGGPAGGIAPGRRRR